MFSAFKKLTSKTDLPGQNGTTSASPQAAGVQSMSHNLQKKFAKVRLGFLRSTVLRIAIVLMQIQIRFLNPNLPGK